VGLFLERKIILHGAGDGPRHEVNGCLCRQSDIDVAGVVGEAVFAARAQVAIVSNIATGGIHRDFGTANGRQANAAIAGDNIHTPARNIGELDGATHGLYVHVYVAYIAYGYASSIAFKCDV